MNYRIFFTLFPKGYWLSIAAGIFFLSMPKTVEPGVVLINLGVFFLGVKAAIIIHETGHLLAAKIVGGLPRRMVLGKGHELYRIRILDVRIIINSNFLGGHAYASLDQPRFQKLRHGFYILGGVLLNILPALAIYILFDLNPKGAEGEVLIAIPGAIFLANALMIFNLIPFNTTVGGMKIPSDGLALLKLPFAENKEFRKRLDVDILFEGQEYLESKDYQSALPIFNDFLSKYPDNKILSMNVAYILLMTGQPEKSLEECEKLLSSVDNKDVKRYSTLIHNQLAWIHLVLNNLIQAEDYSELAIKASPHEPHIQGTRGSVLIEKGQIDAGIGLLLQTVDLKFINPATLSGAIYLTLGYHLKGNLEESSKYLEFVRTNYEKLGADEKILFERILSKIGQ